MNGLTTISIELTSRCNKSCWMCGRRKLEREHPELCNWGDMEFELVEKLAPQVPEGIMVQFHWNGEPTLYPRLGEALSLYKHCIRQFDTNGKLILDKAYEIIDNLDVLTVSVIEKEDPVEEPVQKDRVERFIKLKGNRKPRMVYRCLGDVDTTYWEKLQGMVVTRTLHKEMGSFGYKKPVTKPEIGICIEMLSHLAIDRFGKVSACVRFDPYGVGVIGDANKQSLEEIWNGKTRQHQKQMHIDGRRDLVRLCSACDYWGIPIRGTNDRTRGNKRRTALLA